MCRYFLFLFFLFLDQGTKYWAMYELRDTYNVFSFLRLVFVKNTGIAFSLPVPIFVVVLATIGILGFIGWHGKKNGFSWAYGLIAVGAIGNLIDRVWHGYVVDFISVGSFPVFNVADICISVGVGLLVLAEVMDSIKKSK